MDLRWLTAFFTAVTPVSIPAGQTTGVRHRARYFGSILFKRNVVTTGGGEVQRILLAIVGFCALTGGACAAENAVKPGDFVVERPTLLSLGFEWKIAGDDNRNAAVAVTYRKKGESPWRDALPMMRLQREQIPGPTPHSGERNFYLYTTPNMFAGSILGL